MDADSELIGALDVLPANGDEGANATSLITSEEHAHGNDIASLSIDRIGYRGDLLAQLSEAVNGPQLTVYVPPLDWRPPRRSCSNLLPSSSTRRGMQYAVRVGPLPAIVREPSGGTAGALPSRSPSAVHAQALRERGVKGRAMFSLEMIGYFTDGADTQQFPLPWLSWWYPSTGNFIAVVGKFGQGGLARRVERAMAQGSPLPVFSLTAPRSLPGVGLSDHANYWEAGYPAVMITDTAFYRNPHYHTRTDTAETLDYRRMALVVEGVYAAVKAMGEGMLWPAIGARGPQRRGVCERVSRRKRRRHMKKEMLEALEHISTHTVQLGQMLERMSAQIAAHEARLAQMLIDHGERMEKALQAIRDTAARPVRTTGEAEALTSLVTDPGETS